MGSWNAPLRCEAGARPGLVGQHSNLPGSPTRSASEGALQQALAPDQRGCPAPAWFGADLRLVRRRSPDLAARLTAVFPRAQPATPRRGRIRRPAVGSCSSVGRPATTLVLCALAS